MIPAQRSIATLAALLLTVLGAAPSLGQGTDPCCPANHPDGTHTIAQPVAFIPQPADPRGNKFPLGVMPGAASAQHAQARTGTLAIQAIQGTAGGPAIGAVPVEIQLFHRGNLFDTLEAQLDAHGVLVVEDLPIAMGIQPFVRIKYQGLTYQKVGDMMAPAQPDQTIRVNCYEPTEQPPSWKVSMRHVVLAPAPEGLHVTEVIVIENPADRTWTGTPGAFTDENGEPKAVTTVLPLPPKARGVSLSHGFHDWCCTTLQAATPTTPTTPTAIPTKVPTLFNHVPLTPGRTEMVFGYVIPASNGVVQLRLIAPADTDHMLVLVPDECTTTFADGLEYAGTDAMGDNTMRLYTAQTLGAGQGVELTLAGLGDPGARASANLARTGAAVGGGIILVVAIVLVFTRSRRATPADGDPSNRDESRLEPAPPSAGQTA